MLVGAAATPFRAALGAAGTAGRTVGSLASQAVNTVKQPIQQVARAVTAEGSNDDPINSNSAMTGSYYEGKETQTQEGDALLARIKSLALLR
jgi:hypothetical protein